MRDIKLTEVLGWVLAFMATSAQGDTVYLTNGRILEGRVTVRDGKYRVEQVNGVIILDAAQVQDVLKERSPLDEFEERLAIIRKRQPQRADEFSALGAFCAASRMHLQAARMYTWALTLDSENSAARLALGYVRHEGEWMTADQAAEAKGLVKHEGRWVAPEIEAKHILLEANRLQAEQESKRAERAAAELALGEARRAIAEAEWAKAEAIKHRRRFHTVHQHAPEKNVLPPATLRAKPNPTKDNQSP